MPLHLAVSQAAQPGTHTAPHNHHHSMHHPRKTIGALAAASALVAGNASAGTPTPTTTTPVSQPAAAVEYTLHAGYSSEYLWRGLDLGDDLVEAGLDVAAEWNGLGLSAGAWYASFAAPAGHTSINTDELDLYGEVSKDFGFIKPSIGYIAYLYPNSSSDTYQEVYFGLAHDFGFVDVSFKYYWDVDGDNDGYSELALSHSFELSPCWSLNLGTNVGYLFEQGVATAWTTKVSVDWGFAEHAKLSPFVAASIALTDDADTAYYNSGNELVGGCMLSVTF
jgi:hypothetical protein